MKKTLKFKRGDYVSPLKDLTQRLDVTQVWWEDNAFDYSSYGLPGIYFYYQDSPKKGAEFVACGDGNVYRADALTFFSEPISVLAEKIKQLEEKPKKFFRL